MCNRGMDLPETRKTVINNMTPLKSGAALLLDDQTNDAVKLRSVSTAPARVRPLRIAVIAACPLPAPRGTPIRIQRLSEALATRGHDIHIATYHLGNGSFEEKVEVHRIGDIPSYRKMTPGPTFRKLAVVDRRLIKLTSRLLRSRPFDVIHAHHYEGLLVARAARGKLNIPIVYDAHTLLASELPFYRLGLPASIKHWLGDVMDRRFPSLADYTVSVTDTIREKLLADGSLDAEHIEVVKNGVELEHFRPKGGATPAIERGNTVIYTGNLAEYQGIDNLLEAFRIALDNVPKATLVIASDSSFDDFEALAHRLNIKDKIKLVASPRFDELPDLLAGAAVAVNPRVDCDGVPVKLLNYMAAALPVVSFNTSAPGVTHLKDGWLTQSGDVPALANGIIELLCNPVLATNIGNAAVQFIEENCQWDLAAQKCEQIYARLLDKRARNQE